MRAATWLRAGVTIALTAFVAARVDWGAFAERLESGRPGWFAAAVGLVVAALVVGALRWWQLLGAAGVRLDARQLGRVCTVSTFSSTFLPTSVGGDVARALLVAREPIAVCGEVETCRPWVHRRLPRSYSELGWCTADGVGQ